jgi:hypothetical protein
MEPAIETECHDPHQADTHRQGIQGPVDAVIVNAKLLPTARCSGSSIIFYRPFESTDLVAAGSTSREIRVNGASLTPA